MKKSLCVLLLFSVSCAPLGTRRDPAAISGSEVSCLKLHQAILRRNNDLFEIHHFHGLADMPAGVQEVAESLDHQGINYRFIRKIDEDLLGLEILPDNHSLINRYVKNINMRFDGVRVFYLDVPQSRTLGSFTPSKNYIFLGKKVITNLNGAGYTTLSHEARHAYFTARILRYMDSAYKGQITASKGTIRGSKDTFGYTSYMSFQEIKTFREDSRKFLQLWQDELYSRRIHHIDYWNKYSHKIKAAHNFLRTTQEHLDHLMVAVLEDRVEFKHRFGVVNVMTEFHHDADNVTLVNIALGEHFSPEQLADPRFRDILKENAIKQINRELDQIFIDNSILHTQHVFKEELEEFTDHTKAVFFSKFAHKNSLVNARNLRITILEDFVHRHYNQIFGELVDGQNIGDDAAALSSFAELVRRSHVSEVARGYVLDYKNGQFKMLIDHEGIIRDVRVAQ